MPQLFLGILLIVLIIAFVKPVREVLLHPRLWRFFLFFCGTIVVLLLLAALIFFGWHWWKTRMQSPAQRWNDTTIWQDPSPVTPRTGREKRPSTLLIQ